MQILVTGADGFIGKNLIDFLSQTGFDVFGLDVTGVNSIKCDLTKPREVQTLFQKYSPEVILHLAAISSTDVSFKKTIQVQNINFLGTVNILEIAQRYNSALKYFVLASSAEVYGGLLTRYYHEFDLPESLSPYAASKAAAETFVLMKGRQKNLKTCCIRFCNTFGRINNKSFLIEYLFHSFLNNTSPLLKTPESVREFMYLPDHLKIYDIILKNQPSGIINASSGNSSSILGIAEKIKEITGRKTEILRGSESIQTTIRLNIEKIKKLGFDCKYTLEEGLLDFYNKIK